MKPLLTTVIGIINSALIKRGIPLPEDARAITALFDRLDTEPKPGVGLATYGSVEVRLLLNTGDVNISIWPKFNTCIFSESFQC